MRDCMAPGQYLDLPCLMSARFSSLLAGPCKHLLYRMQAELGTIENSTATAPIQAATHTPRVPLVGDSQRYRTKHEDSLDLGGQSDGALGQTQRMEEPVAMPGATICIYI